MDNKAADNSIKKKAVAGLGWKFLERFGAQGVTFVVSIVLARLLDPEVYGVIAIVTVFTAILDVFVDSGFGNALIQKKDADDLDFSTVFYFNIVLCLVLYGLMYLCAPLIARFYKEEQLTVLLRVLCLTVVVSGVRNVQNAYVSRNLQFKKFFFSTIGGTIGAAIAGIWMALKGYGVWALVAQSLFNCVVGTVILWLTVGWRPKAMFSFERLKGLFSFGWKLLASSLIVTVYNNLRQLIIGKLYNAENLAFYNKGYVFPNTFIVNVNTAIDSVLLPVMSSAQDNVETVKALTRRSIKTASYVIWPLMMGLAACAEPLVSLLLTDKWLPCVPFMRIFCIHYAFFPMHTANLNAIKALGRSDIYLKLESLKKILGLAVLAVTMWMGIMAIAYSLIFLSLCEQIVNAWPNKKLLNYSYGQQIKDILPSILLSAAMGVAVWCVQLLGLGNLVTLLIQFVLGLAIYVAGSVAFKFDSFYYVLNTLKDLRKKNTVD